MTPAPVPVRPAPVPGTRRRPKAKRDPEIEARVMARLHTATVRGFVCLGPPRPKARPRVTPFGTYTPARTKQYERAIKGLAFMTFATAIPWDREGQYRVTLLFASARPLAGDVDNYVKSVLDGLEGSAFLNDRQVVEVRARKAVEPGRGARTEVLVERVGDAMPEPKRRRPRGDTRGLEPKPKRKTRGPW